MFVTWFLCHLRIVAVSYSRLISTIAVPKFWFHYFVAEIKRWFSLRIHSIAEWRAHRSRRHPVVGRPANAMEVMTHWIWINWALVQVIVSLGTIEMEVVTYNWHSFTDGHKKPMSMDLQKRFGRGAVSSGLTHECGVFGAMACGDWPTQVSGRRWGDGF